MDDLINVSCPHCGANLKLKSRAKLGKKAPCPKCKNRFVLNEIHEIEEEEDFLEGLDEYEYDDYEVNHAGNIYQPASKTRRSKRSTRNSSNKQSQRRPVPRPRIQFIIGGVVAIGLIVAVVLMYASRTEHLDLAFLPPDADFLAAVDVQAIWNAESTQEMLKHPMLRHQIHQGLEEMEKTVGFRPGDVVSVTFGAAGTADAITAAGAGENEQDAVAVVRLKKDLSFDTLKTGDASFESASHDGHEYVRIPGHPPTALFVYDSHTLVVGSEPSIQSAIERGRRASSRSELGFVNWKCEIAFAFVPKDPPRVFQHPNFLMPPGGLPLLNDALQTFRDEAQAVGFWTNTTSDDELALAVQCSSPDGASSLAQTTKESIDDAISEMASVRLAAPPQMQKFFAPAEQVLRGFQTKQEGDVFVASVTHDGNAGAAMMPMVSAMLMPNMMQPQHVPPREDGEKNLKQLAIAMHTHHDADGKFPDTAIVDDSGTPLLSWRVHLLPSLGESALYERFHLDEPWDSPHNKTLIAQIPEIFQDPNEDAEEGKTVFLAIQGPETVFEEGVGKSLREITDGTSTTILLVEASPGKAVEWSKPEDFTYDPDNPLVGLQSIRNRGFHVAFADGAVEFIDQSIEPERFLAMLTATGGELIKR